jgi:uncharacterized delta-60 repeat protein
MIKPKRIAPKLAGSSTRLVRVTLALSLLALLASNFMLKRVNAVDGDLDPAFNGGKVTTSFSGPSGAQDVALQTDGKIVAVGFARDFNSGVQSFAVVRYTTDGNLDTTFGTGGKLTTDLTGCTSDARAVAIQSDGHIVVGGTECVGTSASDFALVRYNSDGSLDPTFGVGGIVITDLFGQADVLNDIAIDSNGRILAVGKGGSDFAVVRYNSDGSLDGGFGTGGIVTTNFGAMIDSEARAVAIQSDTKIVAAGSAGSNIGLARYNSSDGSLDGANFGTGGTVIAGFPSSGNGMALQGSKIVVAGRTDGSYGVARFNNDGTSDPNFGTGGRISLGFNGEATDVAIQRDTKIVTAGYANNGATSDDFLLARFNSVGLDPRFGTNGVVFTSFSNHIDRANGLVIQSDTKIVAAGFADSTNSTFALARYQGQSGGTDTVGLYDPSTSTFYLRNSNTPGFADLTFAYGAGGAGLIPITGDWNGDGIDTVGLYSPANAAFFLRNSNTPGIADLAFNYGPAGAGLIPLVGDWDGDGVDTVGLYDPAASRFFLRNSNTPGFADITFLYGPPGLGLIPIVGDWDGDGVDTAGLFDPATNTFYLRNSNTPGFADLTFVYGPFGPKPLKGDYNNDGVDTIGEFKPVGSQFFLRNTNTAGPPDLTFPYGPPAPGWTPLIGHWSGQ